ncbi:hypothetical protein NT6N_18270 [Oceaniferula spumae]|uniref:Asparagine synthetase domain-containing protein n=1 Tax=Oceaniferula spumae TaxID=2979115 RepID=A0AAT9FL06_9BACT
MNITYRLLESLPRFSWGAKIQIANQQAEVFHGSGVEISDSGHALVEGAWNGSFSDFNFANSTTFSGTGIVQEESSLLFCSSTDRLSPVFSIQKDGYTYVSNSYVFAMQLSDTAPHPLYPFYNHDILRHWRKGDHAQAGRLHLDDGHWMNMHVRTIVTCGVHGQISYRKYQREECPKDYDHYFRILSDAVTKVLANARDPLRKIPLESAAALSKGYDSSATSRLARDAGCKIAHTLLDTKAADPHHDSGAKHAAALGMECLEFDRYAFHQFDRLAEPEFCFNSSASSVPVSSMEDALVNRIYVTAPSGESAWDPKEVAPFENFSSPWVRLPSGLSQIEFRLRVGYIVFAPPSIALIHNHALLSIAKSEEMKPWNVDNPYNRPVARRIAETGGIPSDELGRKNFGGGHASLKENSNFSKLGLETYTKFNAMTKQTQPVLRWLYWRIRFALTYFLYYKLLSSKKKYIPSTPMQRRFPFILNSPPQRYTWKYAFTFQWGYYELKERYQITR